VPRATEAQEPPRVRVVVDYVGVEGVYLPVGTTQGAAVGDTLRAYANETDATPLGLVVVTSAARQRSVGSILEPRFALRRGDVVYIPLVPVVAEAEQSVGRTPDPAPAQATRVPVEPGGASVSGRISFDVDARETTTSFAGADLFGTTRRRFATPVTNVSLRVDDLPGGFRVETSVRAAYRYSDGVAIQPERSVRFYSLAAIKTFDSAPLELRLGRFSNPYEPYSAYWDGGLIRIGGRRVGVGAVAGFEPQRGNEGFSQDVAKVTGFADLAVGGSGWSYSTDVSYHVVQSDVVALADQTFAGWSQRLSLGRVTLDQRVRMDRFGGAGSWSLAQARARAGLRLTQSLRFDLGFGRLRPGLLRGDTLTSGPVRDEVTAGFSVYRGGGYLRFDAGSTQWGNEARGLTLSGAASASLGTIQLYASGSRWSRPGSSSLSAAPGLGFAWRWLTTRLGYQYYRTESTTTLTSQAGSIEFRATPAQGYWLTLGGEQQWGDNFGGKRIRLTLGRSF